MPSGSKYGEGRGEGAPWPVDIYIRATSRYGYRNRRGEEIERLFEETHALQRDNPKNHRDGVEWPSLSNGRE